MAIEMIETEDKGIQLIVQLRMAGVEVVVSFYSGTHCTVLVTYEDSQGGLKSVFTVHRNKEVKCVEAALRIVTNFDGEGSEEDYAKAEKIMPSVADARWIP